MRKYIFLVFLVFTLLFVVKITKIGLNNKMNMDLNREDTISLLLLKEVYNRNILLTGSIDAGNSFVIMTDEHGDILWTKIYQNEFQAIRFSTIEQINSNNIWLFGFHEKFNYNFFKPLIIVIDKNGQEKYIKEFENYGAVVNSIYNNEKKEIYLQGYDKDYKLFLMKVDNQGDILEYKDFGNIKNYSYNLLYISKKGLLIYKKEKYKDQGWIAYKNTSIMKLDINLNKIWEKKFDERYKIFSSIKSLNDNYYIVGNREKGAFIEGINGNGNTVIHKNYKNKIEFYDICILDKDNFAIIGKNTDNSIAVLKLNRKGVIIWENNIDIVENKMGSIYKLNDEGFIVVIGSNIIKFDNNGNKKWEKKITYNDIKNAE